MTPNKNQGRDFGHSAFKGMTLETAKKVPHVKS